MTPVEVALVFGNVEVAELLIKKGGIHATSSSSTAAADEDQYKGIFV